MIHFTKNVCSAWADFNFHPPVNDYAHQFILNNSYIKINKSIILLHMLCQKMHITNFFDENGNLLSCLSFTAKLNVTNNFPFMLYYGILKAIPT